MRRHASKRSTHHWYDRPVDHDWAADVGYVIFAAFIFFLISAVPIVLLSMCSLPE